ncbi:Csa1 family protein, partial [Staphylococcus epidermidis]|uniref:Csa1 family protein n=1 Tax=Staphylococcus epidermidis TaxID=1282 RepID=UPI0011A604AB
TPHHHHKNYPIKIQHNKIIPIQKTINNTLKTEIHNFKFFLQYPNFKHLNHYKNPHLSYNPKLPTYSPQYQLNNPHYNLQQLTKTYHIPT